MTELFDIAYSEHAD